MCFSFYSLAITTTTLIIHLSFHGRERKKAYNRSYITAKTVGTTVTEYRSYTTAKTVGTTVSE